MTWLGKHLFPMNTRRDREIKIGVLWAVLGLVVILAVLALLLNLAKYHDH